jgi:hypothetical protein
VDASLIEDIGICVNIVDTVPISEAARYKMKVCSRSLAGIAVSNPTGSIDIYLM